MGREDNVMMLYIGIGLLLGALVIADGIAPAVGFVGFVLCVVSFLRFR
jgi:hypothetical protein